MTCGVAVEVDLNFDAVGYPVECGRSRNSRFIIDVAKDIDKVIVVKEGYRSGCGRIAVLLNNLVGDYASGGGKRLVHIAVNVYNFLVYYI